MTFFTNVGGFVGGLAWIIEILKVEVACDTWIRIAELAEVTEVVRVTGLSGLLELPRLEGCYRF